MTIEEFTKKLEQELEDLESGTLKPNTNYRDLKNWSSMYALVIIAFIDFNFDVTLNGNDLKSTQTVSDLYNLVKAKKNGVL